jgi:uncharacterized membrane protein YhhN
MNIYLAGASLAAALAYGLVLVGRPPTMTRMLVKTAAVGLLAVIALVAGAPWMLVMALAFSALGDAFMAEPDRFLPAGMTSFLVAHLLYSPLFLSFGDIAALAEPARAAGVAATVSLALVLLRWLWPTLGRFTPAVIAYVIAITGMVAASFLLPVSMWPAMAGAVAFMASDAILAGELFRKAKLAGSRRLTNWAVWFLYYGGQALIAYAVLETCCSRQVI